jgi:hypothetical protein
MIMLAVNSFFAFLAVRDYPWGTLVLAIPLATLAGLLDAPPNLDHLNAFASDVATVLTRAVFLSIVSHAIGKFVGRLFRRRFKPT